MTKRKNVLQFKMYNGQRRAYVQTKKGQTFSIQTNGNAPLAHRFDVITAEWGDLLIVLKEICTYAINYGSLRQVALAKEITKEFNLY